MFRSLRLFRNQNSENDESSPLLIDAEAQNYRTSRHSFRDFPLSEFVINFELINETFPKLQILFNHESLKITDCASFEMALESISILIEGFLKRFNSAMCLHVVIDNIIGELFEAEFFSFYNSFKDVSKAFVIIFESKKDNSTLVYWRLKGMMQMLSVYASENSVNFSEFLKKFLIKALKERHNGIHPQCQSLHRNSPNSKLQLAIPMSLLADKKGLNLLVLAAMDGNEKLVKYLLTKCNTECLDEEKIAIDFAYENNHLNVVVLLLKENSRFPHNFESSSSSLNDDLMAFVDATEKLHNAINSSDLSTVEDMVRRAPNLRFFYDTQNRSALNVALTSGAFDIYKLLMARNCTFGPHEIFSDILAKLTKDQKLQLAKVNSSMLQCVGDKHILMLMSNTQVGPDDKQTRLSLVCDSLQKLNTIPGIKILLQIVAATRNFQLIFDFNREHILFLQPAEEGYITGLFDICGRIYIGAQHLLNPSRAHEVLGVIAHELCHYVMFTIFRNNAKPYGVKDNATRVKFDKILEACKGKSEQEEIISSVFRCYSKAQFAAELVVRVPHALGLYINQAQKLQEFKENFKELTKFYEDKMMPIMQEKLPSIEESSERKIRKEYSSPLNFIKYHWRKVLFGLSVIGLISFLITLTARSCIFKLSKDPKAFCSFEWFTAVWKCHGGLHWQDDKCFQCLSDDHCPLFSLCYEHHCYNSRNIFICANKSKRILSTSRCDGIKDCDDKSDETYNCIYGRLSDHDTTFWLETPIRYDNFLIYIDESTENCTHFKVGKILLVYYLPANISRTFPNLTRLSAINYEINNITKENLGGLFGLKYLNLSSNNIVAIHNAFDDLHSLEVLDLSNNELTHLDRGWFASLSNLTTLLVDNNHIGILDDKIFENFTKLEVLGLDRNRIIAPFFSEIVFGKLLNLKKLSIRGNFLYNLWPYQFKNQTNLRELYLTLDNLRDLDDRNFAFCENLIILNLRANYIEEISDDVFINLKQLEVLDLSINKIQEVNNQTFRKLTSLKQIFLSNNYIIELPNDLLVNSHNLRRFAIDNNEIIVLKTALFQNNTKLEKIKFEFNKIVAIQINFIDKLTFLHEIDLRGNNCTGKDYRWNGNFNKEAKKMFKKDIQDMHCERLRKNSYVQEEERPRKF